MHHIPRFFIYRKKIKEMDSKQKQRKPRLERRNALKNIDYDAESYSSPPLDCASPLLTRSLDLSDRTSFRIEGIEGEFDRICRSLGLSGPDDFAIPTAAWETRKIRSSSFDIFPRSRLSCLDSPNTEDLEKGQMVDGLSNNFLDKAKAKLNTAMESVQSQPEPARWSGDGRRGGINGVRPPVLAPPPAMLLPKPEELEEGQMVDGLSNNLLDKVKLNTVIESVQSHHGPPRWSGGSGRGGIKGVRPPVLAPPPAMSLPVIDDMTSTWDIFRAFAPDGDTSTSVLIHGGSSSDEDHDHEDIEGGEVNGVRVGETSVLSESCSFTTSNDDDSSSTTTEPTNISPNGRFRRSIAYWERGELLGRGSFGSVYQGFAEDGFFFAVKEVSLIDQGTLAEQSVFQLEQEIALLSQFEHENIVQYYGTDKDESKLYIFLEFVTLGSLANLYKKYHLRDSQVSAYTRQILHGLKYLHDRNVVHRDIKCANILVDVNGLVKLADFGLAKATKLNDVKSCKGTAFWMAPEVVRSRGYGLPADIWSLGCTVLEMLTSQLPYSDLECMQALFRIGKGIPPLVPDTLSIDARDLILQCLRVNPNDRPTAAQLLDHPFLKRPLPSSSVPASPHNFIRRL